MADVSGLEPLVRLLSDGRVHSGQALGEALGVSRAAVWKQLQKLEQLGLQVSAVKGSGYQLAAPLDLLDGQRLRATLRASQSVPLVVQLETVVDSTNQQAMAWAEWAAYDGTVLAVLAEQQLAGRGRRGRQWVSPFAANIYLSLVASFSGGVAALEGLSLAVGVAVRRALLRLGCQPQLKWPNDILCDGKKLGGILLEITGDPVGDCRVIIGVGLNVAMSERAATGIDQPWTDLASQLIDVPSRTDLAATLIKEILKVTNHYQRDGFVFWQGEWMAASAFTGETVQVQSASGVVFGTMIGVDADGALLLEGEAGEIKRIIGGEISLRLKAN